MPVVTYTFLMFPNKGQALEYSSVQISKLNAIDLSSNLFDGEIPTSIGDYKSLMSLNLSHNSLVGKIPSSLANLTQLESLDLSNNDLVGEIPSELTSLTFLSVLNVSRNHLIGMIPSGRQFDTFPSSSFEGNSRLCGIQLQIDCNPNKSGNVAPPSDHANQSNGTNFDWIFAVAGYGSGLVVGVVIEHFVLWRNRYYLEKFMNTIRFFQGKRPLRVKHAIHPFQQSQVARLALKTRERAKHRSVAVLSLYVVRLSLFIYLFEVLIEYYNYYHRDGTVFSSASSNSNTKSPSCLHNQSSALLQFKASFTIDVSYALTPFSKLWSWKANTDCCTSWDGVTCDDFGFVIGLNVSDSGIVGNINSNNTLFNLYHLQNLNLAFNDFNSSSIPAAFSHLRRLTHLNLSAASFWDRFPLKSPNLNVWSL
ncbi:hypothetical protein Scep_002707 [Stephania cephalantha]|uniref:Leucine-rich repeat-containing N-terminal plant-type domain-containing protein n=1 Tax=Stephania cephalantha TaxID=152367 RepID=A0AAP0Q912_9MAGN